MYELIETLKGHFDNSNEKLKGLVSYKLYEISNTSKNLLQNAIERRQQDALGV